MPAPAEHHARSEAFAELIDESLRLYYILKRAEESMHAETVPGETERDLLFLLFADGARSVPQLARERGFTRQRVQQVMNQLRDAQLVRRLRNPASDKSPLHTLTATGRRTVLGMLRKERRLYGRMPEALTTRRLRTARSTLQDLRRAIDALL